MFPASTNGGGQLAASAPDVCQVPAPPGPPVPTPFPNLGSLSQASTCSSKVRILNRPTCTARTEVSRTSGDEAGTAKGVMSGTNMDKAAFKSGTSSVQVEGNDIVAHLAPTGHNGSNANAPLGSQVSPSQTKVIVSG